MPHSDVYITLANGRAGRAGVCVWWVCVERSARGLGMRAELSDSALPRVTDDGGDSLDTGLRNKDGFEPNQNHIQP